MPKISIIVKEKELEQLKKWLKPSENFENYVRRRLGLGQKKTKDLGKSFFVE